MNVENFLSEMHGRLRALQFAHDASAATLSPRFNVFNLIEPGENKISSILAWLLDVEAEHAQGALFLDAFLKVLGFDWETTGRIAVKTESKTDAISNFNRRIDIVVKSPRFVIGIENKLWALDQPRQVRDYIDQLQNEARQEFVLVYLTPNGRPPTTGSIEQAECKALRERRQLVCLSYAEIADWLDACRKDCRSDKVRTFMADFSDYIRLNYQGIQNMTGIHHIASIAISSTEMLNTALSVAQAASVAKKQLIEKLQFQLQEDVSGAGWMLEWFCKEHNYFTIRFDDYTRYAARFQFCAPSDYRNLIFGAVKTNDADPANCKNADDDIRSNLVRILGNGKRSPWYIWEKEANLKEELLAVEDNWVDAITPWIAILDGSLRQKIIGFAHKLHDALVPVPAGIHGSDCAKKLIPAKSDS